MAESKKPTGKKIVDVAHPGKSAPSPSSRPVIVTNRPILKDPMMVDQSEEAKKSVAPPKPGDDSDAQPMTAPELDKTTTDTEDEKVEAKPKHEKTIAELAVDAKARKKVAETGDETPEPDAEPESEAEPTSTEESTEGDKKDEEPSEETVIPDAKPVDSLPDDEVPPEEPEEDQGDKKSSKKKKEGANKTDKDIDLEGEEQAKHDADIQKLIESKKYFLPINAVEKRRNKRAVVLGVVLCLVLILAWADIALDAGLIQAGGVKPVTHFFSN